MSRSKQYRRQIWLLMIAGMLVFVPQAQRSPRSDPDEAATNLQRFAQIYAMVEENYATLVDADTVMYKGAIPGMLRALDPHSTFYDLAAFAALHEQQRGAYFGIGLQIGPRGDQTLVIAPTVGSPAYQAGIRPGDIISAIDGTSTAGQTTEQISTKLRGPPGTQVRLAVLREGTAAPLDFLITREEIARPSVDVHFLVRPRTGYIRINSFSETTSNEVRGALDEFGRLDGLVIDLRQNGGGLLIGAVRVADMLLPKRSVVVSQRGRSMGETVFEAREGSRGPRYPLVVMVDGATASAAEILAAALQDHDRALIVGRTTFGKGSVQTIFPLSEKTGMALTTGRYYTPSGRTLQRRYEGISVYDYYAHRDSPQVVGPAFRTDRGRAVYGGNGITPDVLLPEARLNQLQRMLLRHYAFFDFAKHYLITHHPAANFTVSPVVLQEFRSWVASSQIVCSEQEVVANRAWIEANIQSNIFIDAFGVTAGLEIQTRNDPEVQRALELLPMAQRVADGLPVH